MQDLKRVVSLPDLAGVSPYQGVRAGQLRSCLDTYRGADGEKWLLLIKGGCVIKVDTVFQVSLSSLLHRELFDDSAYTYSLGSMGGYTTDILAAAYHDY
jgi:hypothetical protein